MEPVKRLENGKTMETYGKIKPQSNEKEACYAWWGLLYINPFHFISIISQSGIGNEAVGLFGVENAWVL